MSQGLPCHDEGHPPTRAPRTRPSPPPCSTGPRLAGRGTRATTTHRDPITNERLWAEFDAEAGGGIAAMERVLREDMLGEASLNALEPAARVFIATGEKLYREHRNDPAFDFGPVVTSFAKALEVQVNAILRRALPVLAPSARRASINGRTEDLIEFRPLNLGELVHAMTGERELYDGLARVLQNGAWFTGQFPAILDGLREVRNAAAHDTRIRRSVAALWRDRLLGVGCAGDFVELARVRLK